MGLPRGITEIQTKALLKALEAGNTRPCAADLAGIPRRVFLAWLRKGREVHGYATAGHAGQDGLRPIPEPVYTGPRMIGGDFAPPERPHEYEYGEFYRRVTEAEAKAEQAAVAIIRTPQANWTSAAWWLERRRRYTWRRPETFERREEVQETAAETDLSSLSDADLQTLQATLAKCIAPAVDTSSRAIVGHEATGTDDE